MNPIIKLSIATLIPVVVTVILRLLEKKGLFKKVPFMAKQVLYGIIFGGLAILGTEWGIPINGAQVNCRDGAVLIAGLCFGGPAGIIAGFIGGIERWFAVYWGIGSFTRVACSVSTILAGFYGAFLRRFLFKFRRPHAFIAFASGVIMEVLHLTMVFLTNMGDPYRAIEVVKACTVPMITANAVACLLASLILMIIDKDKFFKLKKVDIPIINTFQKYLLITVVLAFILTTLFVFEYQTKIAQAQTDNLLILSNTEVAADIKDASDENLLQIARKAKEMYKSNIGLVEIRDELNLVDISVINKDGIIINSITDSFLMFDMGSTEQSRPFNILLKKAGEDRLEEYVQDYVKIGMDQNKDDDLARYRKYAGIAYDDGYIQVGYDAQQFQSILEEKVTLAAKNRNVGESGYIFILDKELHIVSAPKRLDLKEEDLNFAGLDLETDTTYKDNVFGVDSYFRFVSVEGYILVSILPESEAMQMRNISFYVNTFMEVLVFAIIFGILFLLVDKIVVKRFNKVNEKLGLITNGDLDVRMDVKTNKEFAFLSNSIDATVDTLKTYITEAQHRIDEELEFAKNIQASALPSTFPAFPKRKDLDIYASMNPAKTVGGDFYDFYITQLDTLNFLIADVSGKGIPAAMFMMRAKTELKSLTEADLAISDVFTNSNNALCEGNDAGMFVTAWQGSIDLTTGLVNYANAGHNPPLVKHANGKFEYLKGRAGFVLAGFEGFKYKSQQLKLEPGDIIYLYTDGVTEATNSNSELFGEARLLEAINSKDFANMEELCKFIKASVDEFVGEAPQFDDITMVALKYIGTPEPPTIHFDEAKISDIPEVTEFVENALTELDCPMKTIIQFNIAVDEIYSNIVNHGYGSKPGPVTVKVVYKSEINTIYLRFIDNAVPYNPLTKADPDVTLSAEERGIGGLGIYMVKKSMDDIKYKYENNQNILTICKKME